MSSNLKKQANGLSTITEVFVGAVTYFVMEFLLKDEMLFDILSIGKGLLCRTKRK